LVALVVREGLAIAVSGLALGLLGGLWASRLLQSFLYGVQIWDPLTYGGVVALVVAISAAATYVAARRVTRIAVTEAVGR
jgi:putative ABC transport system permease protein